MTEKKLNNIQQCNCGGTLKDWNDREQCPDDTESYTVYLECRGCGALFKTYLDKECFEWIEDD